MVVNMIESVYVNEKDNNFCYAGTRIGMPRNVRQIGKSNGAFGIYIEDYVKSYMKQIAEADYMECNVAILIGKYMKNEYGCNLFIHGAMHIKEACIDGRIDFSQEVWEKVYERLKTFFPGSEAVGWFIGGPGFLMQDEEMLLKIHLNNFADREKILFVFDVLEKEEVILISDGFKLITQEGYFVYYEKNDEMQAYMLEYRPEDMYDRMNAGKEKWGNSVDAKTAREIKAFRKKNRFELVAAVIFTFVLVAAMGTMLLEKVDLSAVSGYVRDALSLFADNSEDEEKENGNTEGDDSQSLFLKDIQDIAGGKAVESSTQDNIQVVTVSGNKTDDLPDNSTQGDEDIKQTADNEVQDQEIDGTDNTGSQDKSEVQPDNTDNQDESEIQSDNENQSGNTENPDEVIKQADNETDNETDDELSEVGSNAVLRTYTVLRGDTLVSICNKYYGDCGNMGIILELNQIDNENLIYEGQILYLP